MRGHKWVDEDGNQFTYRTRRWDSDPWETKNTWDSKWSKEKDRVCCNCEKVELHATKKTLAGERMKNRRDQAHKKLKMELKAAKSGPHERALTSAEQEVEDYLDGKVTPRDIVEDRQIENPYRKITQRLDTKNKVL
jgi:hypothetical protein